MTNLPIIFGSIRHENEWMQLHPGLKLIVADGLEYAFKQYGWLWRITSAIRSKAEDKELGGSGIHCTGRAVDIRTRDQKQENVDDVVDFINARWIYDPNRPEMPTAYAKSHGSGPHLHIQVHQNTRRNNGRRGFPRPEDPQASQEG